jgi:hypothetical protein
MTRAESVLRQDYPLSFSIGDIEIARWKMDGDHLVLCAMCDKKTWISEPQVRAIIS